VPRILSLFIAIVLTCGSIAAQQAYRVSTFAGTFPLGDNGPAREALFSYPRGMAIDRSGNTYVADSRNRSIRRISATGVITTFAGTGLSGDSGDGGPAAQARFTRPWCLALDPDETYLYVGDDDADRVRRINLATGVIEAYIGTGDTGFGGDGGPAGNALIAGVRGLAFDPQGNLLIADTFNHRIRRVDRRTGIIQTIAGSGARGRGGDGGPALAAQFASPHGIAVDADGSIYICDWGNLVVRRIDAAGVVSRFAGNPNATAFVIDGPATDIFLLSPVDLYLDRTRRALYVSDEDLDHVRRIGLGTGNPSQIVAGTLLANGPQSGYSGDGGSGNRALLAGPHGLALDRSGNLVFADRDNQVLRGLDAEGVIRTTAGRRPFANGPAANSIFFFPGGLFVQPNGDVLVADVENCVIRRIRSGQVSTVGGVPGSCFVGTDGTLASSTSLGVVTALVADAEGNIYFTAGARVRRISSTGTLSTLARDLRGPQGLALDPDGQSLWVSESGGNRILRINLASAAATIVAGSVGGTGGFAGDRQPAAQALLRAPTGMVFDRQGNLIFSDSLNNRIRRIDRAGVIDTIVGNGELGIGGSGPALSVPLFFPFDVGLDSTGALLIGNANQLMRVTSDG
jgi:DNA-binding beta-propeller fold protein YncE